MLAVAAMLAFNVSAADDDKKPAKKGRGGGIQAMIKQLDLTADQKKALGKFNKETKEKAAEARNAKLKEILTEEQAKKLTELQAKAKADRKKKPENK